MTSQNETTPAAAFTLAAVSKTYFPPTEEGVAKAQEYMQKVLTIPNLQVSDNESAKANFFANYDLLSGEEIPNGFGILTFPMQKRVDEYKNGVKTGDKVTVTTGVAVAAVPALDLVLQDPRGKSFVQSILADRFSARLATVFKQKADGKGAEVNIPRTIDDFLESGRGEQVKTYNEIAPIYVKILREQKKLTSVTAAILRQVLQSATFAKAQYERIPQEQWEIMLKAMIAYARNHHLDPSILESWLKNRATATPEVPENLDFSDLETLLAADEAKAKEAAEKAAAAAAANAGNAQAPQAPDAPQTQQTQQATTSNAQAPAA